MTDRKQTADTILAMKRAGRKLWQITRDTGVNERHVLQILDAFRLIGVDTSPVEQEVML
ncbi:MAG TPA: hypothetical protein VFG62_26040 [Rhodopila sp.]|jgi:hypothetical protein|nr:hypothetical protein [Rhodopila sp.]